MTMAFNRFILKVKTRGKKYVFPAGITEKGKKHTSRRVFKVFLLVLLFCAACGLGIMLGGYLAIKQNLPSISMLETFEPYVVTSIYAANGDIIGELAREKRIEIPYEQIPDNLKKAIIATEDPRFYHHFGIDFRGILRAMKEDIKKLKRLRRPHGGSTITMQLARELFLYPKQTIRRKVQESLLALQIEKKYSKQEILTMYCNTFFLGYGAYGIEAASQLYFGKKASELDLEEAALIAGILRGPSLYSPYMRPKITLDRRNHVLRRMVEQSYITKGEEEQASKKPLNVLPLKRKESGFAAYFKEEVRRHIIQAYGEDVLYRRGLKIYTTLDPVLQRYAEDAVEEGLRNLDKSQGWRNDKRNLLVEGIQDLEGLERGFLSSWQEPSLKEKDVIDAVVLSVTSDEALVKVKDYKGKLTNDRIDWTGTKNLKNLIRRGDVIQVKIKEIDEEKKELLLSLDQDPLLEGALLAVEPQTGQIKAMVGGYDFRRSEWNNATQAMRQAGSAIKPILYTAAIESGFSPASIIIDGPCDFIDEWTGEPWTPPNYDAKYKGAVTLRKALEESRNIPTAKLLQYISPQKGVEYCRKFGITSPVYPYISLALGSFELRLIELVSAFSVFPNKGIRVEPFFIDRIEDKEGNVLEENKTKAEKVISPQVAYIMTSLLQGVIQRGSGIAAKYIQWPLAGKTGTTNDFTNAWFLGFSPSLCAGVWVGHFGNIPIGERKSGAVAALPIWADFFNKVVQDKKKEIEEAGEEASTVEEFEIPPNLSFVEIDYKTGLLAGPFCLFPIKEVFLPGTEPTRFCTPEDHLMILDYYDQMKK
jgi:penicillin-binding protein 1A